MALTLDGNWRQELLRLRLNKQVGADATDFLLAASGESRDATLTLANQALNDLDLDELYRRTDNTATRKREASNEWVLSGAHSVSGKPLLANDPHLGTSAFPGTWYLARLVGPGFDIRGATSPGSPGIVLGQNGTIGWGFTTTNLDSQDLFIERIDPTDPGRYLTPDGAQRVQRARRDDRQWHCGASRCRMRGAQHAPWRGDRRLHPKARAILAGTGHVAARACRRRRLDGGDTTMEGLLRISQAHPELERLHSTRDAQGRDADAGERGLPSATLGDNIGLVVAGARRRSGARATVRSPRPAGPRRVRLGGLRAVRRPAARLQPAGRHHRQRQCPRRANDDYRYFITRDLGRRLYRQRRANQLLREGRAPSGLRHDRHPGRPTSRPTHARAAAAPAQARAAQRPRRAECAT